MLNHIKNDAYVTKSKDSTVMCLQANLALSMRNFCILTIFIATNSKFVETIDMACLQDHFHYK